MTPDAKRVYVSYLTLQTSTPDSTAELHVRGFDPASGRFDTDVMVDPGPIPLSIDDAPCVAEDNELWMVFGVSSDPTLEGTLVASTQVKVAASTDRGASFATRTILDDDSSSRFLHPSLLKHASRAPTLCNYRGSIAEPPGSALFECHQLAGDGRRILQSRSTEARPSAFVLDGSDPRWLGDYWGGALTDANILLALPMPEQTSHIEFTSLPAFAR